MTEQQVVELMESSHTQKEWNDNCDKVKAACGGYPPFWYGLIVSSGLMARVTARWGGDDRIHVSRMR